MKLYIRKAGQTELLGPTSDEEIHTQVEGGTLTAADEVLEAAGQNRDELRASTHWTRIGTCWPRDLPPNTRSVQVRLDRLRLHNQNGSASL